MTFVNIVSNVFPYIQVINSNKSSLYREEASQNAPIAMSVVVGSVLKESVLEIVWIAQARYVMPVVKYANAVIKSFAHHARYLATVAQIFIVKDAAGEAAKNAI